MRGIKRRHNQIISCNLWSPLVIAGALSRSQGPKGPAMAVNEHGKHTQKSTGMKGWTGGGGICRVDFDFTHQTGILY